MHFCWNLLGPTIKLFLTVHCSRVLAAFQGGATKKIKRLCIRRDMIITPLRFTLLFMHLMLLNFSGGLSKSDKNLESVLKRSIYKPPSNFCTAQLIPEAGCRALWFLPAPSLALVEREVSDGVVGVALVVNVGHLLERSAAWKDKETGLNSTDIFISATIMLFWKWRIKKLKGTF